MPNTYSKFAIIACILRSGQVNPARQLFTNPKEKNPNQLDKERDYLMKKTRKGFENYNAIRSAVGEDPKIPDYAWRRFIKERYGMEEVFIPVDRRDFRQRKHQATIPEGVCIPLRWRILDRRERIEKGDRWMNGKTSYNIHDWPNVFESDINTLVTTAQKEWRDIHKDTRIFIRQK